MTLAETLEFVLNLTVVHFLEEVLFEAQKTQRITVSIVVLQTCILGFVQLAVGLLNLEQVAINVLLPQTAKTLGDADYYPLEDVAGVQIVEAANAEADY